MTMNAIVETDFPTMPAIRAEWAPIYMEPIMKSGERITVGIAAIADGHAPSVALSLREEGLKCVFGENGVAFLETANVCIESLNEHIRIANTFAGWVPPFYGVELGDTRLGAGDTIAEIIRMALRMTASFSALEPAADDSVVEAAESEDRWAKQIRDAVQIAAPQLEGNFGKPFRIADRGTDTKFDYLGWRYAAGFGKIIPTAQRKSSSIKDARAKLWTLARLRDAQTTLTINKRDLILYRPRDEDPAYSDSQIDLLHEVLTELEEESKKEAIDTFAAYTANDAAERIIEMEKAA